MGVWILGLFLLPGFAQINLGQNETNILTTDLSKLNTPENRIARIDKSLENLVLRLPSVSPHLESIFGIRGQECLKTRNRICPLSPSLAKLMCSEKFRVMPHFDSVWSNLFLGTPSRATSQVWQQVLNSCAEGNSSPQVLAGLIYLRNWLRSGNVGESVEFFSWLAEKFDKMDGKDRKVIQSLIGNYFSGTPVASPAGEAPKTLISILPVSLLVRFHNYQDYDIVVSQRDFLKKVVESLSNSNGPTNSKVLGFLVDLGFVKEGIAFYKKNEKFLTDKWDTYNLCVLHKVIGRYDDALACIAPLKGDSWFEYEIFDINYLKNNRAEAEKSLEKLRSWSSPYRLFAQFQLRKPLSPEDVKVLRRHVERDYVFGFLALSYPLDKLGLDAATFSSLRSTYFNIFKGRFFVTNFNNREKLIELAQALGPLHNVSRAVRQKFPDGFPAPVKK